MSRDAHEALLKRLDTATIEVAIKEAERATTGEIRVAVLPPFRGTIEEMTERTARRLGMTKTSDRNGVLILVDPARRTFRVWGDRSIHEKVGEAPKAIQMYERAIQTDGLSAAKERLAALKG